MDYDQIYTLVLTGIITPFVGYAVALLFKFIDEKLNTIKNERLQKALKEAKAEMELAIKKAITETNATFVEALKADGNFSEEDARIALAKSVDRTKEIMSETALTVLQNASIAIDEAITNEIEVQLAISGSGVIVNG